MPTECARIADQLRFAFTGDAWHGPNIHDILSGLTAEQAAAHPIASAHSIWELALHIALWADVALRATSGIEMPRLYGTGKDWSTPSKGTAEEWSAAQQHLFETAAQLADAIAAFDDARLHDRAPGRDYDFYYLFHGIVQHSLYHAG